MGRENGEALSRSHRSRCRFVFSTAPWILHSINWKTEMIQSVSLTPDFPFNLTANFLCLVYKRATSTCKKKKDIRSNFITENYRVTPHPGACRMSNICPPCYTMVLLPLSKLNINGYVISVTWEMLLRAADRPTEGPTAPHMPGVLQCLHSTWGLLKDISSMATDT